MLVRTFVGTATQEFSKEINTFTEAKDKDVRKVDYQFTDGRVIASVYYMPAEWMSFAGDGKIDDGGYGAPIKP